MEDIPQGLAPSAPVRPGAGMNAGVFPQALPQTVLVRPGKRLPVRLRRREPWGREAEREEPAHEQPGRQEPKREEPGFCRPP